MDLENKIIGRDFDGSDLMAEAMLELLNSYPGLQGEKITFEQLEKDFGIALSANNGALIYTERKSVTGHIRQECRCPFFIVYRSAVKSEKQKLTVQRFLDGIGRWLCREPIILSGQEHKLRKYPQLTNGREIKKISRDNYYGIEPDAGIQDWLLPITVEYTNEFDR